MLVKLVIPLRVLRLRPSRGIEPFWTLRLAELAQASWWAALERLEIWLPGVSQPIAGEVMTTFDAAVLYVPPGATLAIGVLDANQRTGWMVAGDRRAHHLELLHPDARVDQGPALADATGLALDPGLVQLDDWLALALGVPSIRKLL